ncbi:SGNH/GDSL hydrolase family protein [Arthrobacter sp. M4]|uniref:SGNH/GDSL hydrolase family protein n=1 Tax=Arthrobacter sp. M4 TaxID=218160 RepID=UPI001CDBB924|nr:SGNH/GDSL hydrolase family protein [Arthrobacter sp. M4]MCA4131764.1 SGNH/GDSL hydrolase family protein [Arthrobacter sp. M4]
MNARRAVGWGSLSRVFRGCANPGNEPEKHPWKRYVALGDSFTEGLGDPEPGSPGGLRGWADRVAEELGKDHPGFTYANLAVRGLLLEQILNQQTGPALALEPDLISLNAGGNDLIFRRSDPDKLAAQLDAGVELLGSTGATLVLFTGPDWGGTPLLGGSNRAKVAIYNENIRTVARRHHAVIADLWSLTQEADARMWDPDRLHFSPEGHRVVAMTVLDALHVPHSLRPLQPRELPERSWHQARAGDLLWARRYLIPWALGHLGPHAVGNASGAKRPDALTLSAAVKPPASITSESPATGGKAGR